MKSESELSRHCHYRRNEREQLKKRGFGRVELRIKKEAVLRLYAAIQQAGLAGYCWNWPALRKRHLELRGKPVASSKQASQLEFPLSHE